MAAATRIVSANPMDASGRLKMRHLISRDRQQNAGTDFVRTRDHIARVDSARPDNAAPDQTEMDNFDNCLRIVEPTHDQQESCVIAKMTARCALYK